MVKIGLVDTTFAKVDMAKFALQEFAKHPEVQVVRFTVPGIKDLPVACKKLLEEQACDGCLAIGMVGKAKIDVQCAHEASTGIINAQLMTNKFILGVMVFQNEAKNPKKLLSICEDRARKHAENLVVLLTRPRELTKYAGQGLRQGKKHEGALKLKR